MKKLLIVISFAFLSLSASALEEPFILRAAVAEAFPNGLHTKYLRYIANQLGAEISISTMPFARRVKEIKNGHLDIIVGIQKTENRENELTFIGPHYESLSYRFYTLAENVTGTTNYHDLYSKLIGVNKNSKYFPAFDIDHKIKKIEVVNLRQNIKLVSKGRIDLLIHYAESTLPLLKSMNLDKKIVQAQFQPNHTNLHYVAISNKSPLMKYKNKLRKIIKQAIKNKDFSTIRQRHYQPSNENFQKNQLITYTTRTTNQ